MSMSTNVSFISKSDNEKKDKANSVIKLLAELKLDVIDELYEIINDSNTECDEAISKEDTNSCNSIIVDLSKIPKEVNYIKFSNCY